MTRDEFLKKYGNGSSNENSNTGTRTADQKRKEKQGNVRTERLTESEARRASFLNQYGTQQAKPQPVSQRFDPEKYINMMYTAYSAPNKATRALGGALGQGWHPTQESSKGMLSDIGTRGLDVYKNRAATAQEREKAVQEQLSGDSWDSMTNGSRMAQEDLNWLLEDTQNQISKTRKGSEQYNQLVSRYLQLQNLKGIAKYRRDYANSFAGEDDYSHAQQAVRGLDAARQAGKSADEYYRQAKNESDVAYSRYQDAQAEYTLATGREEYLKKELSDFWNKVDHSGPEKTLTLEDGTVIRGLDAIEAYRDQLIREYSKEIEGLPQRIEAADKALQAAAAEYKRAQGVAQYAKAYQYSDLKDRADWSQGIANGRQKLQEIEQRRQTEHKPIQWDTLLAPLPALADQDTDWYTPRLPTDDWTENQKNTYLWLLDKRGEDTAFQYAIEVNAAVRNKNNAERYQSAADWAPQNMWTRIATDAVSFGALLTSPMDYYDQLQQYIRTGQVLPNENWSLYGMSRAMNSAVAEDLNKRGTLDKDVPIIGGKGWGDAWQLKQSALNSVAGAKLFSAIAGEEGAGAMLNAFFYTSAAVDATNDALARGATPEQAMWIGNLSGAAEVLGEQFSIENLIHMQDPTSVAEYLVNWMVQSGIESSEEGMTNMANTLANAIVYGDKSDLQMAVLDNLAAGMSRKDAEKKALADWAEELGFDMAGGFVSGGISTGANFATSRATQRAGAYVDAATTRYAGDAGELLERARASGESGAALADRYQKRADMGKMSYLQAAKLAEQIGPEGLDVGAQLKFAFGQSKIDISDADMKILTDGYIEGETDQTSYVIAMRDGYRMGAAGTTLSEARKSSRYANQVYEQQFRHAWELGSRAGGNDPAALRGENPSTSQRSAREDRIGTAQKDAAVTVQGQDGRIRELKLSGDGQLQAVVENADGSTRTVKAQELEAGESGLGELLEALQGRRDAAEMFRAYPSGMRIGEFVRAWDAAKAYGKATSTRTAESFFSDAMLRDIDRSVIDAAFAYGRSQRPQKASAAAAPAADTTKASASTTKGATSGTAVKAAEKAQEKPQPAKRQSLAEKQRSEHESRKAFMEAHKSGYAVVDQSGSAIRDTALKAAEQYKLWARDGVYDYAETVAKEMAGIWTPIKSERGSILKYDGMDSQNAKKAIAFEQMHPEAAKAIRQAIEEKHGKQLREAAQKDAGKSAFSERDTEQAEQKSEQPAKAEKSEKEEAPVEEKKPERTETARKGSVSYDGATVDGRVLPKVNRAKLTATQKAQIEVVQMLSEKFGIRFVLFESPTGKSGQYKGINGAYQDGVIYLDVKAGLYGPNLGQVAIVRTAAHELTHFIKDYAPAQFQELQDFLLDNLTEWKGKTLGDLAAQKLERDSTGKLTMEDALEEVVADGCEMMLQRTQVMQKMAQTKPTLYQKVKDWLKKWADTLREAFTGVSAVHEEARAVAEWEAKRLDYLVELWDKGLIAAAENAQRSPAKEGGEVKYSFAGERAETADREKLQAAQEMEKQGIDAERIRQETGWFRGLDGKWRFEIDDSGMQLFRGGDAQFAKDHPEYGEYKELLNKVILGTANAEELARVKKLEETWGRELPRLSQRVKNGQATLQNIIQHEALFEAYPELRNLRVSFGDLPSGERGQYVQESGSIILSNTLRNETNSTLLHEIQHAIQHLEGFSNGATPEYWQDRIDYLEGRIEADQKFLKSAEEEIGLKEFVSDSIGKVSRGERSLDEHWKAMQDFKDESDRGEEIRRLEEDLKELRAQRRKLIDANEAYFSTAGEIEARDTARRHRLTAEQRKNTRPDLNRRGVVFADDSSNVLLDADADQEILKVKNQLKANNKKIMSLPIISKVQSPTTFASRISDRTNWAYEQLRKKGTIVDRANFGKIKLDKPQIHKGMTYARTEGDKAAFLAIHDVLKRGIQIEYHPKHKGGSASTTQDVESWTFAGHVDINGVEGIMAVIVQKTNGLNYKAHKVLMPDGSAFLLQEYIEKEESGPAQGAPENGWLVEPTDSSSTSILSSSENSKPKFQERDELPTDRELLMAARAEGRNAETLTAYQKKVRSLEALERKLQRQMDALEAAKDREIVDAEGKKLGPKEQKAYNRKVAETVREQIRKTEASIARAEKALADMERSPQLKQETEKALAAWREANPHEAAKAIREMQQERDSLKSYVKLLREEARLTTPETRRMLPSDVRKMAQALVKEQGSEAAVDSITEKLQKLGDFMASNLEGGGVDYYNQIVSQARQIAKEIVDEAYETIDDNREIREGVRNYLRNHTLQISDSLRGDIPDFERWRKSHMGTLRLGTDGVAIGVAYQDLQSEYGEYFFPSDVMAPSDQLMRILDVLDMTQPTFHQMYSQYDAWQASEALGNEIVDRLLSGEVREKESMADKAFQRKMQQLEEKYARKDQARQKALENAEDQMLWERRMRDAAEEKRREERALRRQLVAEKVHELRERSIERDKQYRARIAIDKKVVALSKIMLENSGKRHVPDAWKEAIGGFLASIDTLTQHSGEKSRSFHVERIQKLREMVEKQQAINAGQETVNAGQETNDEQQEGKKKKGPQVFFDMNPYIADLIKPFVDLAVDSSTGTIEVQKLSLEQMKQLEEILTGLREAVDKADQLLAATEKGQLLSGVAGETIRHLESLGKGKTGGILRRFLSWDNTTPVFFFKRFGAGGEAIFRGLQQGWGKLAFNARQIIEFSEKTYTAKEAREWEKEIHEFKLVKRESDLSGRESLTKAAKEGGPEAVKEAEERNKETVKLSTAQLMGIYCLAKREQAAGHILGGGIRIWDINEKPTLKERITGKSTQEQAERYLVTEEDLAEMEKALTPRQKEVADALQKYMNTVGTDWGNEVSQARYGVDLFTEKNYYPITTDPQSRNVRSPEADGSDLFHILNMGFTKKTVEYARNGIVIHSIFDVFAGHMADMAKYNSMGLPMLDAMKWINYLDESGGSFTSVRKAMETAYGKNAERYFLAFIQDLNGSFEGGRRGEDLASKLISHSKVASVGANLRVAALQPTSYVRALAVLDPKYMYRPGNIAHIMQGIEEAQTYSGTAVWKDLGFFDMNINRNIRDLIKHTDGAMEKVREASMKGAELGDKATWGRLWNATKAEVRAKTGLSGEALLKATAERFDDVIYQTQVMDSTMTRSHLMRQKGAYASMVTSFMSEPTLSYNLLLDAVSNWQTAKRSGKGLQVAGKYAARAFAVYAISQVITSIAESIFDAFRDDDDYEKWWQKFLQAEFGWDGNLWQDLAPYNKLPFLRDAVSIFQGYSNKRMDTEWLEYWVQAANAVRKDMEAGEITWNTAYKCMRALGTLTGLPISNAARDSLAMWNTFVVGASPDFQKKTIKRTAVKPLASIKAAYQAGALSEEAAIRYMLRDAGIESEDKARQKIREWSLEKGEKTYDQLLGAIRSGKDGKAQREELLKSGYSEDAINNAVREAAKAWFQGTAEDGKPRIGKDEAVRILVNQGGMKQEDAEARVREWSCYVSSPEQLQYSEIREAFLDGEITERRAAEMLTLYGGKSKDKAQAQIYQWKFAGMDDDFQDITESAAKYYYEQAEKTGMSEGTFYEAWSALKDIQAGEDTKKNRVAYISKLNIPARQKDALFLLYYKENGLKETPWH